MSAGLATSTVTPGSTAPVSSVAVPAIVPVCAKAAAGHPASSPTHATRLRTNLRMLLSSPKVRDLSERNPQRHESPSWHGAELDFERDRKSSNRQIVKSSNRQIVKFPITLGVSVTP